MSDHAGVARVRHLVDLGRWQEALASAGPLLAADPDAPDLHELTAQAHEGLGEHQRAVDAARRAVALAPEHEFAHRLLAGLLREREGSRGEAHVAAREAVRLAPTLWATHACLAMTAVACPGHLIEAGEAADTAVRLGPQEPGAHFAVGYVAQERGDREGARAAYRRVLSLEPAHSAAMNNLAMLESGWRSGRALRGYGRALRADPQSQVSRANLQATTGHLLRRVLVVGFVGSLASVVLTSFGTQPVNAASRVAGALTVTGVVVLAAVFWRGTTRGVRRDLWSTMSAESGFVLLIVLVTAMVLLAVATGWVPGVAHGLTHHGALVYLVFIVGGRFLFSTYRSSD